MMDVVLKTTGNYPYAEVLFSGKTGSRHIPLINSIPYVKDWLDHGHPHTSNPAIPYLCGQFDNQKNYTLIVMGFYENSK